MIVSLKVHAFCFKSLGNLTLNKTGFLQFGMVEGWEGGEAKCVPLYNLRLNGLAVLKLGM